MKQAIIILIFTFFLFTPAFAGTYLQLPEGSYALKEVQNYCQCIVSKEEIFANAYHGKKKITKANQSSLSPGKVEIRGRLEEKIIYSKTLFLLKQKITEQRIQFPEKLQYEEYKQNTPNVTPALALLISIITAISYYKYRIRKLNRYADACIAEIQAEKIKNTVRNIETAFTRLEKRKLKNKALTRGEADTLVIQLDQKDGVWEYKKI